MFNIANFIGENITSRPTSLFAPDIEANKEKLREEIEGRSLLVIGGAGSIGSSYIRAMLPFSPSKLVVVDDKIGLEGTFNMDYRSYYLNYECGVLITNTKAIARMKQDYLSTLKVSERITMAKVKKVNIFTIILRSILNVFSPLL